MKKVILLIAVAAVVTTAVPAHAGRLDAYDMFVLIDGAKQVFAAERVVESDVRIHEAEAKREEAYTTGVRIDNAREAVRVVEDGAYTWREWRNAFKGRRW